MAAEKPKHSTIHDVAERAGVSKSLVSLVMRGSPNVSEKRRRAVLDAARELNYSPNAAARALARSRSGVFGVVVSDLHNPFLADVADGIEEEAVAAGYRALLSTGFLDADRERTAVDTLIQLRADGLILLGNVGPIDRFEATTALAPIVVVSRQTQSTLMDSVADDDRSAPRCWSTTSLRSVTAGSPTFRRAKPPGRPGGGTGYESQMRHHGLADEINVVEGAFTRRGGRAGMERLLETTHGRLPLSPPTTLPRSE